MLNVRSGTSVGRYLGVGWWAVLFYHGDIPELDFTTIL